MRVDDLEIIAVLVCDDVRREDNGKEILIGVYSGGAILLSFFPTMIKPVFWCHFKPNRSDSFAIGFRVMSESGAEFFRVSGDMTFANPEEPGTVAISGPPIQAQGETKLILQIQIGDSDWKTIHEVPIRRQLKQTH